MKGHNKVAIVGIACRFPGGIDSLDAYWEVLRDGKDVVSEVPDNRWSKDIYGHPARKTAGRSYTWAAGVLSQIDGFDAEFFGISPREAAQMDPQQRLLLELTWEALEDGGFRPDALAGTHCGVFIGIASNEYGLRRIDDLASIDAYTMLGNTVSIGSNRLSYIFDLRGPSMSVDTACSSSLVAFHLACQSIRNNESSMAIVGGVNMLLHPFGFVGFSKASMLSPHGRCRAFDADGDGYVRAEGAAILVLKPLAQAQADGDRIYATVLGTGVNCDGRTSSIAVPGRETQATLLNEIYTQAGIDVNDLAYVEAHGTGTSVGDPLETGALGDAIGKWRRKNNPLPIGSAKTNVGHLEVASGAAGLVKTILCLKHRALPPSLHFRTPNPLIDFGGWNLRVVEKITPLPETSKPLLMGVNSFGFGGANAHALLEEYRPQKSVREETGSIFPPLFLSARKPEALAALAGQYAQLLELQVFDYYDIAWSAVRHRQPLEQGAVFFAAGQAQLIEDLRAFAAGATPRNMVSAEQLRETGEVALVYSGNGSQWLGMGAQLFKEDALFRKTVRQVDAIWRHEAEFSIVDELLAAPGQGRMHLTEVAQPALFAVQVGITKMLLARGLRPTAAFGHSVGEVAAAWASGALTLAQAVRVVHERSFAQAETQGQGRMAAVSLAADAMEKKLAELDIAAKVCIAAVNSPKAVTVSGDLESLLLLQEAMTRENIFFRLLELDYAFHSPYMDAIEPRVHRQLLGLKPANAKKLRYISTVAGAELQGAELDAGYWWHNIRQPVQFRQAVDTAISIGARIFVEIGPHPVLCRYIQECLQEKNVYGDASSVLKRDEESSIYVVKAFYRSFLLRGGREKEVLFPRPGRFVDLPAYPWQREKYWYAHSDDAFGLIERRKDNPLLGYRLKVAPTTWENTLDTVAMPWLADHQVGGAAVLPAAGYVEMALAASRAWLGGDAIELEELDISAPMVLDEIKTVHFTIAPTERTFSISQRGTPIANVSGRLLGAPLAKLPPPVDLEPILHQAPATLSGEEHYRLAESVGLSYGPAFQGVAKVWAWIKQRFAWGNIRVPECIRAELPHYLLHPALLDSCLQLLVDIFSDEIASGRPEALIPVRIGKLRLYRTPAQVAWCRAKVVKHSPRSIVADFDLYDADGNSLASLEACRFRRVVFVQGHHHEPAAYVFRAKLLPALGAARQQQVSIPDYGSLLAAVSAKMAPAFAAHAKHFQEVIPLMEVLGAAFCLETLRTLNAGKPVIVWEELLTTAGIAEEHAGLLQYMLTVLEEDALLVCEREDRWVFVEQAELPSAQEIWRTLLDDYPEYLAELTLLAHCGSHLPALLTAKTSAQELLYNPKSSTLEHWYNASPSWRIANAAVVESVCALAAHWPANRRLRVLAMAGSHFSLTRALLSALPAELCDYVLIDADESVIDRAQALFGECEFFQCQHLNIEALPENLPETFAAGSFDVAIAAGVLHNSDRLEAVLHNLRKLLAYGGLLVVQERDSDRFANLTFGTDPRWWLPGADTKTANIRLLNSQSWQRLLAAQGFDDALALVEPEAMQTEGSFVLLAANLRPEAATMPVLPAEIWVLLTDTATAPLAAHIAEQLRAEGQRTLLLLPENSEHISGIEQYHVASEDVVSMAAMLKTLGNYRHVVHLQGMTAEPGALAGAERCLSAVTLLQALERASAPANLALWFITTAGVALPETQDRETLNPYEAAFWGFGRVVMNEYPGYQVRLLDLPAATPVAEQAQNLVAEFLQPSQEDEIVLRANGRYALRMRQLELSAPVSAVAKTTDMALDFSAPGSLHNLYWRALPDAEPLAPGQIQIRPCMAGLNFRDVMYTLGMLSDEAVENGFAGAHLGMELSGVVERVAADVAQFKAGDEVISFAPACFATRVITAATATAHKPAVWSHAEGATIPAVYFTVYYALQHLAQLRSGERILIHGAAGGVGLAAIQYAQAVGAEIFATAGSDEKRTLVRMMGVEHVMDSRSLAFADEVMALTHGEGVDVVLNSLAGEAVWRNLSVLRPFGRFLELGKRDFYENSKLGLRPFRNNISYFGIDADQLLIARKTLAAELFRDMMALFQERKLKPLPYRVFPAAEVVDAFRTMQQSRQIGKVLVAIDDSINAPTPPQATAAAPELRLDAQGSYLISGGLSGLGLKTAQWLAAKGAKHLILLGRRGAATPEAIVGLEAMRATGVEVYAEAVDITDMQQLAATFATLRNQNSLPPLKGVIHAAAVIDDGLIRQMQRERFLGAFLPKVQGAWNLHRLCNDQALDFFVVYSSMTTFLGNPGQANYVAANSYLEAFAEYRRGKGLPATYVAFGAIDDVGFLTRNQAVKDLLTSRLGAQAISSDMALHMLEKILLADIAGAATINIDWRTLQRFLPSAKAPKFEQQQRRAARGGADCESVQDIKAMLASLPADEALRFVMQLLAQEVAQILRLPAEKIDLEKSVFEIGMDSLMGMELVSAIENRFALRLPLMALAEGASIRRIAGKMLEQVQSGGETGEQSPYQQMVQALASRHEDAIAPEAVEEFVQKVETEISGADS